MSEEMEPASNEEGPRKSSRRSFLKKAAMGATAVGVATAAPGAVQVASTYIPSGPLGTGAMPLIVYVKNASRGELALMVGTKEIVVTDFGLVSRLLSMVAG